MNDDIQITLAVAVVLLALPVLFALQVIIKALIRRPLAALIGLLFVAWVFIQFIQSQGWM